MDDFHNRRQSALNLASLACGNDEKKLNLSDRLEQDLCDLCRDRDGRIRAIAVDGLMRLCTSSDAGGLSMSAYGAVCQLCDDTDESVRVQALRLITIFSARFADSTVRNQRNQSDLRLADDAFSRVCNAVHDLSVSVRSEACRLLGEFVNVSDPFIEQTLDKKIMVKMRLVTAKSGKPTVRREPIQEWSTGKKLGGDMPAEKVDEEGTSMIPSGACGAFVSGLEDEFMVVRQAAVHSLSRLANSRPNFASKAIDHLADMFNDEIEQVRLEAIYALTPLVVHGQLGDDQLETILNDAMADSRAALRELLCKSRLATCRCVRMAIDGLLHNLQRFPTDRESIWLCLKRLGEHHANLVQPLVIDLLVIHPFLETAEPKIEDASYMCKLILVLNAAASCAPICSLLPKYALRHYRYLRNTNPHLVNRLQIIDYDYAALTETDLSSPVDYFGRMCTILKQTYMSLVDACEHQSFVERSRLMSLILRDLDVIRTLDERIAPPARFLFELCSLISACDQINQLLANCCDAMSTVERIDDALTFVVNLQHLYCNIDIAVLYYLAECQLRLGVQAVAVRLGVAAANLITVTPVLIGVLQRFQSWIETLNVEMSVGARELVDSLTNDCTTTGDSDEDKKPLVARSLVERVQRASAVGARHLPSTVFDFLPKVALKTALISEPNVDMHDTIRFVAGLLTGIPFIAELRNFSIDDTKRVRLKITYPDKRIDMFKPRCSDFVQLAESVYRLRTQALLSAHQWTDAASVDIDLVIEVDRDRFVSIPSSTISETPAHARIKLFPKNRC